MGQNNEDNKEIDFSDAFDNLNSGVKLEGEQHTRSYDPGTPKIIQWVIKYSGGLVKDEKQASYVLIGFVAVAIVIPLFLIFSGSNKNTALPPKIMDNNFNKTIQIKNR